MKDSTFELARVTVNLTGSRRLLELRTCHAFHVYFRRRGGLIFRLTTCFSPES